MCLYLNLFVLKLPKGGQNGSHVGHILAPTKPNRVEACSDMLYGSVDKRYAPGDDNIRVCACFPNTAQVGTP